MELMELPPMFIFIVVGVVVFLIIRVLGGPRCAPSRRAAHLSRLWGESSELCTILSEVWKTAVIEISREPGHGKI